MAAGSMSDSGSSRGPTPPGENAARAAHIAAHHYSETADFQRMQALQAEAITQGVTKVLVIYTGGTIGMKHDRINGYIPVKGYLTEKLKSIGRFHDPEGFSDFGIEFQRSAHAHPDVGLGRRGDAGTPARLSEWLITPRSMYERRVQYCFLEYDPLLDSCNMDMADWVRIVTDIEHYYYTVDAFIILHGTDTMSYTASALGFMLQNLGKTVIVTGSQVPIAEVRNDGIENFLGALTIAGHFVIPEVSLYFNNKLFRGNRCIKVDAMDFDAFSSPNLPPLVKVGVDLEVSWANVLRPNAIEPFYAHKQMDSNVATLRLFPGILPAAVRAFLAPPVKGVVLETFGAGNAPDAKPAILAALAEASERGVVIVNVTQCQRGNVSDLYATARGLTRAKVVPGRDMTSECALTKLSYLLGRGFSPDRCREMLSRSLRGELTAVQMYSRPIFYSGQGRAHTFTQFVSRQILDETRLNESDVEPTPTKDPEDIKQSPAASADPVPPSESSPLARETVTERASIYRSFFPVFLCAAAATGDLQGMYLLEEASGKSLEVTCYDYTGQTPLHSAVRAGQLPCVRFLLKRGASVHVLSRQGHTPLFAAISSRHPEMVSILLQAGAHFSDAEIRDLMLSMQNAVARGDIEFVKLVVSARFDVNTSDHEGRTILYFAVISSQVEIVEYLLSLPAVSVDHWDHWGYSPMDYVLRKLDLWDEFGTPNEDRLDDMQRICTLFSNHTSQ
ncbi:hypothetical protein GGF46_002978 [Coemansia sp. RSA 552]|nr:hypothetical protein GGF46_002978 [Coemansia sp. RSA 552]